MVSTWGVNKPFDSPHRGVPGGDISVRHQARMACFLYNSGCLRERSGSSTFKSQPEITHKQTVVTAPMSPRCSQVEGGSSPGRQGRAEWTRPWSKRVSSMSTGLCVWTLQSWDLNPGQGSGGCVVAEGLCSKYGSHVARELSSRLNTLWSEVHHRCGCVQPGFRVRAETQRAMPVTTGGQDNADLAGGPSLPC